MSPAELQEGSRGGQAASQRPGLVSGEDTPETMPMVALVCVNSPGQDSSWTEDFLLGASHWPDPQLHPLPGGPGHREGTVLPGSLLHPSTQDLASRALARLCRVSKPPLPGAAKNLAHTGKSCGSCCGTWMAGPELRPPGCRLAMCPGKQKRWTLGPLKQSNSSTASTPQRGWLLPRTACLELRCKAQGPLSLLTGRP